MGHKAWRQVHRLWPVLAVAQLHVHLLQVDFVEVYQDQVRDLLINPNEDGTTRMPAIDVRESPTQGVFLEGVRYVGIAPLVMGVVCMLLQLSAEEQTSAIGDCSVDLLLGHTTIVCKHRDDAV